MSHQCKLICDRFLKNIKRTYTGNWSGAKTKYDPKVYNRRVIRNIKAGGGFQDYTRCSNCNILLSIFVFNKCPCCGNSNMTKTYRRGGRAIKIV